MMTKRELQLHLYYGDGKGKTTAALGQALRAWGRGWKVLIVQFLKDAGAASGEVTASDLFRERWTLLRSGLPCSAIRPPRRGEKVKLQSATTALLEEALEKTARERPDLVVLDESLAAWKLGFLRVSDLRAARNAAASAGAGLLVMTGRWAPASIIATADLATELVQVKHPFQEGGEAMDGIEY